MVATLNEYIDKVYKIVKFTFTILYLIQFDDVDLSEPLEVVSYLLKEMNQIDHYHKSKVDILGAIQVSIERWSSGIVVCTLHKTGPSPQYGNEALLLSQDLLLAVHSVLLDIFAAFSLGNEARACYSIKLVTFRISCK